MHGFAGFRPARDPPGRLADADAPEVPIPAEIKARRSGKRGVCERWQGFSFAPAGVADEDQSISEEAGAREDPLRVEEVGVGGAERVLAADADTALQ
jgi:hypothetical protein